MSAGDGHDFTVTFPFDYVMSLGYVIMLCHYVMLLCCVMILYHYL